MSLPRLISVLTDGNNQRCTIRANVQLFATATEYNVESGYDYLSIGTQVYSSENSPGPQDEPMGPGDTMLWQTDQSITSGGFTVCGSTHLTPPPPAPPVATALIGLVSGSKYCEVTTGGTCVTDGVDSYGNNERCTFRATQEVYLTAYYYDVEACCDYLTVGDVQYRGNSNAPYNARLPAGGTMQWRSDTSIVSGGFIVCASTTGFPAPPPLPSPSPPPPPPGPPGGAYYSPMWTIIAGREFCEIAREPAFPGGTCVSDGAGRYGRNEHCTIIANVALHARAIEYDISSTSMGDFITIDGVAYVGTGNYPNNVPMSVGSQMTWQSDSRGGGQGFTICGELPPPPPPAPRPPPPPPSPAPPPMPPVAPGSAFVITEGSQYCQLAAGSLGPNTCVTDGSGNHGNNERCTVRTLRNIYVTATEYQVESCCDYVTIGGTQYHGAENAPQGVYMPAGSTFSWRSDFSVGDGGFTICSSLAGAPPPPPPSPLPPTTCSEELWPDVYNRETCGACKVVVDHIKTHYRSCSGYCNEIGRTCVDAWQTTDGSCNEEYQMPCLYRPGSDDDDKAICQCSQNIFRASPPASPPHPSRASCSRQCGTQSCGDFFYMSCSAVHSQHPTCDCGDCCLPDPPPPPYTIPPPPALPSVPLWELVSGGQWCSLSQNGACVTDGESDCA